MMEVLYGGPSTRRMSGGASAANGTHFMDDLSHLNNHTGFFFLISRSKKCYVRLDDWSGCIHEWTLGRPGKGVRPSAEPVFDKHFRYRLHRGLSRDAKLNTQLDQIAALEDPPS